MAKYVYTGWGPETGPDGELTRPFDEREFAEQPTWGRWALIGEAIAEASAPVIEAMKAPQSPPPGTTTAPATPLEAMTSRLTPVKPEGT